MALYYSSIRGAEVPGGAGETFIGMRRTRDGLLVMTAVSSSDQMETSVSMESVSTQDLEQFDQSGLRGTYTETEVVYSENYDLITSDGTKSISLSKKPRDIHSMDLFQNNIPDFRSAAGALTLSAEHFVRRKPGSGNDYTLTHHGNVITLSHAPDVGDKILIMYHSRRHYNDDNDKFQQYAFASGDITYFIGSAGNFIKRTVYPYSNIEVSETYFEDYVGSALINNTTWSNA